jgi:hypothetical protein
VNNIFSYIISYHGYYSVDVELTIKDLTITPLLLIILYIISYVARGRVCKNYPEVKKYFIPAITFKFLGALALGMVYYYYYQGGDTTNYFELSSRHIWDAFNDSPLKGLKLIFTDFEYDPELYDYSKKIYFWGDHASYFVVRVSALFGLLTFHTYTANAILFAYASFWGLWLLFITLYSMYPELHKKLAISVFFIPSMFFWGSGLMKDTLTVGLLGVFFYAFYNGLIKRKKIAANVFLMIVVLLAIKIIKIYVILCFIPAALIWLFLDINDKIKSPVTKKLIRPIMLIFGLGAGYLAADQVSKDNEQYKLDNIANTSVTTAKWISHMSKLDGGSSYSLGEIDGTTWGMIKKFPAAVFVTLFQPFLWQSKNFVMLFSAIESTWFLWFTFKNLLNSGGFRILGVIRENRYVAFALIFSIVFAFGVGISSYNFGSLVRYKIPLLPFYASALYIIKYETDRKRQLRREQQLILDNYANIKK